MDLLSQPLYREIPVYKVVRTYDEGGPLSSIAINPQSPFCLKYIPGVPTNGIDSCWPMAFQTPEHAQAFMWPFPELKMQLWEAKTEYIRPVSTVISPDFLYDFGNYDRLMRFVKDWWEDVGYIGGKGLDAPEGTLACRSITLLRRLE